MMEFCTSQSSNEKESQNPRLLHGIFFPGGSCGDMGFAMTSQ